MIGSCRGTACRARCEARGSSGKMNNWEMKDEKWGE